MMIKGALVDIGDLRQLVIGEAKEKEEEFRKVIDSVFHGFNVGYRKHTLNLLAELGFQSAEVDSLYDYLYEWLRNIDNALMKESTHSVSLDYRFINDSTIMVYPPLQAENKPDPISECLNMLEGLVKAAVNEGTYVDPKLKKFFNL